MPEFNVKEYEDLAEWYASTADVVSEWSTRQSLKGAAGSMKELAAEVRRLTGRLEAVCGVLSDADAFDRIVEPNDILRAVRGWRRASPEEVRKVLPSVPYEVVTRWIETGQALIKDDGTLVMDDLSGLNASIADMGWEVDK